MLPTGAWCQEPFPPATDARDPATSDQTALRPAPKPQYGQPWAWGLTKSLAVGWSRAGMGEERGPQAFTCSLAPGPVRVRGGLNEWLRSEWSCMC